MNFRYFGPIDGHDVMHLTNVLRLGYSRAKLLHCLTVKGKGFKQAEKNQTAFHARAGLIKYRSDFKIS